MSTPRLPPFPIGWITPVTKVWGIEQRTYGFVPYNLLPPLPFARFDGSFSWLPAADGPGLGYEGDDDSTTPEDLPRLDEQARSLGLVLPGPFKRFLTDEQLYGRVRSSTGCYLDFSVDLVEDPARAGGRLLRFLNDSQGCVHWYLYLAPNGDHCVLASWEWMDRYREDHSESPEPTRFTACAPSFEQFVCRFWLENRIFDRWFSHQPLEPIEDAYFQQAKSVWAQLPPQSEV